MYIFVSVEAVKAVSEFARRIATCERACRAREGPIERRMWAAAVGGACEGQVENVAVLGR